MQPVLYLGGAEHVFAAWLEEARTTHRTAVFRPFWYVAPNHLIARDLAGRAAQTLGAWANLRGVVLEELAARLAEEELLRADRQDLSPLARRILITALVRETPLEYLAPLAEQRGLVVALDALFADLEEGGFERFPRLPRGILDAAKERDLRALYDAFRERVAAMGRVTALDVFEAAGRAAHDARRILGSDRLAFYGFADLNRAQRRLLAGLAAHMRLLLFLPWRDHSAYRHMRPLVHFIREDLRARTIELPPPAPGNDALRTLCDRFYEEPSEPPVLSRDDRTVRIVSAPDEVSEAREVVRDVLDAAARGVRFHDIAVTYAGDDVGRCLVQEFETAGVPEARVPLFIDGGFPAAASPDGKMLLRLWTVVAGRWRRPEVMQLVGLCPPESLAGPDGTVQPVSWPRWDRVTREAAIVEGPDEWGERLDRAVARLTVRAAETGDPEISADRVAAHQVAQFLAPLFALRRMLDQRAAVPDLLAQVERVVRRMVPDGAPRREFLAGLAALSADPLVTGHLRPSDIPGVAASLAEGLTLPRGGFKDAGVCLLPIHRLRHLSFEHVVVSGLLENAIPAPGRQDPLLLDAERERINAYFGEERLPLKGRRAAEQVYLFREAIGAARTSVTLTFPRADRIGGRERVVSHFVVRVAEALTGALGMEALARVPGFRKIVADGPRAGAGGWISPAEMEADLVDRAARRSDASLWGGLVGLSGEAREFLRRRARRARALWREDRLTPYDGALGPQAMENLPRVHDVLGAPISATRLETYAACPRKYFLRHVLGLATLPEPTRNVRLDRLTRGALLHEVLQEGFERAQAAGLLPTTNANRRALLSLLVEAVREREDALRERGWIRHPLFWERDRLEIEADLAGQVEKEIELAAGFRPYAFEVRFGKGRERDRAESPFSVDQGLELDLGGGRRVVFEGRIDRVDMGEGVLRVIDYKTGKGTRARGDTVLDGGERLQLPVYLLAAQRVFSDLGARGAEAFYFHSTRAGGFRLLGIEADRWREALPSFLDAVGRIVAGIAAGLFFLNPFDPRGEEHCSYCEFSPYCGPLRGIEALFRRKAGDPRRRDYATLREIA